MVGVLRSSAAVGSLEGGKQPQQDVMLLHGARCYAHTKRLTLDDSPSPSFLDKFVARAKKARAIFVLM